MFVCTVKQWNGTQKAIHAIHQYKCQIMLL